MATALFIYLFIGFFQAFTVWIALEDDQMEPRDLALCLFAWPLLWLIVASDLRTLLPIFNQNKWLFFKIVIAEAAIIKIIEILITWGKK